MATGNIDTENAFFIDLFLIYYIDLFFSVIFFLFLFYSNTIFIDVFKCSTYKKLIIECFLLLHLGYLDLYIKLLNRVANI